MRIAQLKTEPVKNDLPISNPSKGSNYSPFCFYQALGYPIPRDQATFSYLPNAQIPHKKQKNWIPPSDFSSFSRETPNPELKTFLRQIEKYHRLYRNLPFIDEIYLANSITFNALKPSSDIDIFVITQTKRIWLARLFCALAMRILGIKRGKSDIQQKFCLSFFVDSDHQNLQSLLLDQRDLYLPYRIAHLVPLYLQEGRPSIYQHNLRVNNFLPQRTPAQHIYLGNKISQGRGIIKILIQALFPSRWGNRREFLLHKIRLTRIDKKMKKNPDLHQGVIASASILKFHQDKRKSYSDIIFWE